MLVDRQVDGLIISTTQKNHDDIELLKKSNFPFVLIDRNVTDIETSYVIVDNKAGAKKAINHLIELGKQKIGHLTITPSHLSTLKNRTQGYKDALRENGINVDDQLIREVSFENIKENVVRELKALIDTPNPIDSLFVANNNVAVACLECLKDMKIRIPEDLALVSFDDIDIFKLCSPPITAVSQPIENMGKEALNILIDQINSNKKLRPKQVSLPTELKIRQSSNS